MKKGQRIIQIPQHDCWFIDWEKRMISGFTKKGERKVKKGDEVRCDMTSGQVARFEVLNVKYLPDPKNQYVAEVKDIAYICQ